MSTLHALDNYQAIASHLKLADQYLNGHEIVSFERLEEKGQVFLVLELKSAEKGETCKVRENTIHLSSGNAVKLEIEHTIKGDTKQETFIISRLGIKDNDYQDIIMVSKDGLPCHFYTAEITRDLSNQITNIKYIDFSEYQAVSLKQEFKK